MYFENDLEVYDEITVNVGNNITQGQPIKVHLSVANTGASDFNGTLDVSLYYLDGSFAETIEAKDNMSLESGYFYSDGLDFETNGITVEPGSYLLALLYHPGTGWELGGSYYYTNPIRVTVQAPSVQGDSYENNDTEAAAYNFSVNFNGSNGEVETTGSNSHTGEDLDYYMVTVPAGYDYTFDVRAHDSYNSGNGQTYTI